MKKTAHWTVLTVLATLAATIAAPGIGSAATTGPQGSLDTVALRGVAGVEVRGWASAGTASTEVAVYVDGVGARFAATDPRPDVQTYLGSTQNGYGFDRVVALPPGTHRVCAYALSQTGAANPLLRCQGVTAPAEPVAVLDSVERVRGLPMYTDVRVTGWVFDPDRRDGPGVLDAYVDSPYEPPNSGDRHITTIDRPDVAAAYGLTGTVLGFSFVVVAKYEFDALRLYAVNTDGAGGNPLIAVIHPEALTG